MWLQAVTAVCNGRQWDDNGQWPREVDGGVADRQLFLSVPVTDNDSAIAVPSPGRTIVGELSYLPRGEGIGSDPRFTYHSSEAPICYVFSVG